MPKQTKLKSSELNRRDFIKIGGLATASLMFPVHAKGLQPQKNMWDHYLLGSAYYPEWWAPIEWEKDFSQMHELGFNCVRMGEFAWSKFEPSEGKFDFEWMDKAITLANRYNIDVILCTPTAAVPPWLYQEHNDVLGANETGPYTYGGRKGYCVNSTNYLQASARITSALALHYGGNPGVIGWQLDNEPGAPLKCLDKNCEQAFRLWLKKRYGTLDELNRTWNGEFWSNKYSDWSQIGFPKNSAESGWEPAISLDYRRFFSDSYISHLQRQAVILRDKAKNQFLFTNWPVPTWSVDIFKGAGFLDASAWDNYTAPPGISEFQHQYSAAFNHDICRCAGPNQRFICPEQIAYLPSNALPQALRLEAYLNLAHGSIGHFYFEWRRPYAGNEQCRPSMVKRFDGTIGPNKPVFEHIGKEFAQLGPVLAGTKTHSSIALLYDFDNQWSQGFVFSGRDTHDYYDYQVERYYRGLKALQQNIDIIPLKTDFSAYKLIVAANLRMINDTTVARLSDFVASGGILVLNNRSCTQNMDGSMRRVLAPGPFTEMAGVSAESKLDLLENNAENGALYKKIFNDLGIVFSGNETVFAPYTILESLTLKGAEPIATFRGGRMAGKPAITRNHYKKGQVFYIATDCFDNTFHEALGRVVGEAAELSPLIAVPYGVEVTSRETSKVIYYFLLNLTETAYSDIMLPHTMDNLLTEQKGITKISLAPLDVAVLALLK